MDTCHADRLLSSVGEFNFCVIGRIKFLFEKLPTVRNQDELG